jgi:hypothetical protein
MAVNVASTYSNFPRGRSVVAFTNQVARTDTSAKDLFALKAGDIPLRLMVYGATASNASVAATLSIGSTSNVAYFVGGLDVKTATSAGAVQAIPSSAANLMARLAFDTIVQATYAEAGTASTAGGPWTVVMEVLTA